MKRRFTPASRNQHPRSSSLLQPPSPAHAWMVSFGDLITLLFCLFLSLNASGVFTITTPNQRPSLSGPSFAPPHGGAKAAPKNRHRPTQVYLTADDLTDVTSLTERLKDMMPENTAPVIISTQSCRSPGSAALPVDFAHIEAATAPFRLSRTFSLQDTACPAIRGKPSVASLSFRERIGTISSSIDKESQSR